MTETISAPLARRIALAAHGFGREHPRAVTTRQLSGALDRLGVLQIDSVNVFERSHYLPLFARLGAYDKTALDKLTLARRAPFVEYWAHEAAFIRREDWPLFGWRMRDNRERWGLRGWATENEATLAWLRSELRDRGPLAAAEIEHESNARRGPWWGWSDVKRGLEYLFYYGEVAIAGRTNFQRRYGLAEQVLPGDVLNTTIERDDAVRELVRRASRALGVATQADIADYYRILQAPVARAIGELVDAGELTPVTVRGWVDATGRPTQAWLAAGARLPRRIEGAALLSPFDPVVWRRERALRIFDFHYRIEIYTPAPKRVFGYYVLPILIDDRVVGRIDLKSDRQAGLLRVQSAWHEPHVPLPPDAAARVADLLRQTASWQRLDDIVVHERGTFARDVAAALGVPTRAAESP